MKYLNGYKVFRFILITEGNDSPTTRETLNFSSKYKSLKEYYDDTWIEHTLKTGRDVQKFLYLHYYFTLDYGDLIEGDDSKKINKVITAEQQGKTIVIVPHIDIPTRTFKVKTIKGRKEFSTLQAGREGNSGLVLQFKTVDPHYNLNWEETPVQNTLTVDAGEDYL